MSVKPMKVTRYSGQWHQDLQHGFGVGKLCQCCFGLVCVQDWEHMRWGKIFGDLGLDLLLHAWCFLLKHSKGFKGVHFKQIDV